jgi:hypothetical protein
MTRQPIPVHTKLIHLNNFPDITFFFFTIFVIRCVGGAVGIA